MPTFRGPGRVKRQILRRSSIGRVGNRVKVDILRFFWLIFLYFSGGKGTGDWKISWIDIDILMVKLEQLYEQGTHDLMCCKLVSFLVISRGDLSKSLISLPKPEKMRSVLHP